jgi:uncharacterized protein (DUF697 family)
VAKIPIDVGALLSTGKKLLEQRDMPVRIAVLVEVDAPDILLDAVREGFRSRTANALVDVEVIEPGTLVRVDSSADVVVVLVGSGSGDVVPTLADLRRRSVPTVAVALRDEVGELPRLIDHPVDDVVAGPDAGELLHGPLADWAMRRLPEKRTAIAHNFEFMRRSVAREAVKATAWQNAAIGGLSIIPGTDMPIMTLNQGKMLLQIAAAYGQQIGSERIKELAAVVGGGFVFRAFARQALTLVPGFGWAIKAGIAYSGTIAMGNAAVAYFERGADVPEMLAGLKASAERSVRSAKERLPRRERRALPAAGAYIELPPLRALPSVESDSTADAAVVSAEGEPTS